MNKYLFDLGEAFFLVSDDYSNNKVARATTTGLNVNENHIQQVERPFMTELYHQWRMIMTENSERYSGLILHATIGKLINGDNVEFPDLALHGGQVGATRDRNEVMVEIKMNNYDPNDMRKLFNSISGRLSYNKGVYIIFNNKIEDIKVSLENERNVIELHKNHFSKLYFLTKRDGLICLTDII